MGKKKQQDSDSLNGAVTKAKRKIGREQLTDEDLLALAAESILHTYTFEEKGYARDSL